MINQQELINWMTEIKKEFSFSKKVKLLKDYWENKDKIPKLEKDVESWTDAYKIERSKNQQLNQKLVEKDDRIAQLDQTLKGSSVIFQSQINIIDSLTQQLQEKIKESAGKTDYQKLLQEDISRLAGERKELVKKTKDLEEVEVKNKELRDKELAELKTKVNTLTQQLIQVQQIDQQIYDILGQETNQTGLLLRSQAVVQKIKELERELYKSNWLERIVETNEWKRDSFGIYALSEQVAIYGEEIKKIGIETMDFSFSIELKDQETKVRENKKNLFFFRTFYSNNKHESITKERVLQVVKMFKEKTI